MADKIEGPFGIWPWQILNTIIAITNSGGDEAKVTEVKIE